MVQLAEIEADGLLAGLTKSYADSIRPALEVVGLAEGQQAAAGVYVVIQKERVMFFANYYAGLNEQWLGRSERALDRVSAMQGQLSREAELSEFLSRGLVALAQLTPQERIRFTWVLFEAFGAFEFMFHAARARTLRQTSRGSSSPQLR